MNDTAPKRDYSETLFLPQTEFPMRAGLPKREPELLERWKRNNLYKRLRETASGRPRFVLHDGPPYANGNIHIGHALNKILKDMVTRSQQMLGYDSNYVPGWDCHGLPIEWKIEEQYRARGKNKDEVPVIEFRKECRSFAEHWLDIQREEFKRLGVEGDWDHPYSTMAFHAEAQIAREIMKFKDNGLLYRGSKPVMWSVVEKTALAEAEIEYQDYQSDMVWVKFPVKEFGLLLDTSDNPYGKRQSHLERAAVVIWTTTPWTLPGNRAISYSSKIQYALYEVDENDRDFGPRKGEVYILAKTLSESVEKAAKISLRYVTDVPPSDLLQMVCAHPLASLGYDFSVPLLDGDHVTDDAGTGFVHTAPSHGRDDFEIWSRHKYWLEQRKIDTRIPFTVDDDGFYTKDAPGFEGKRVITDKGEKGDANEAVIKALIDNNALVARGRLKHQYPHSWRSKKPVIFRNTPQWFIAMDKPFALGSSLRSVAFDAIAKTEWVPSTGENRIRGMIENKPDWVMSRQRAWGVPITVFVDKETKDMLRDPRVDAAIAEAFDAEGGDAWFKDGAKERFLTPFGHDPDQFDMVMDVLDVWFDSGSTHTYTLESQAHFPGLFGTRRKVDGGQDKVMYLEGSDQHRGWFQSSLLESCGTRGRAPFDVVLTHGFVLDEKGQKMSKSLGNVTAPQKVIEDSGADILRLWVAASDYSDDLRIGPEILKTFVETYRKLRNTLRWMLGSLAHYTPGASVPFADMPALERLMLHRLSELAPVIAEAYASYDYRKVVSELSLFLNTDLSAFYFDIRKDTLYCDPQSSLARRAALECIEQIFRAVTLWLAPILVFTAEEAWLARYPEAESVHLETFPEVPAKWRDEALAAQWAVIRRVRRVVTGALEIERAQKRIGSSLEAAPQVHIADADLAAMIRSVDFADICITSGMTILDGEGPAEAFRLEDVPGIAVVPARAEGRKCARSWRYSPDVGSDPDYPDVTPRDAAALREWDAAHKML
jgi:isoleucyl-tRNA synthetase